MSTIHQIDTDDRDFAQLERAFDRPIAPAPSFAASLRQRIAEPAAEEPLALRPASPPLALPQAEAIPAVDHPRRAGFTILEIAAALLLISALAASAWVITAIGRPADSGDLPVLSAQVGQAGADVNWGGDEGRSQYYGDAPVDAASTPVELQIGDEQTTTVGPGLIVGDAWYGWTVRDGVDAFLRVEVATGETAWEREYRTWGTLASDGQRLFAFLIDDSATPAPVPVAIDIETGEIAWRGPALNPFAVQITASNEGIILLDGGTPPPAIETYSIDMTTEEQGPVVAGDTVYFMDGSATTVALNTVDGAERWRDDRSANFSDYSREIGFPQRGTIIANGRYLFVRLPDDSILSLNPATGEEHGRVYYGGSQLSDRGLLDWSLQGDKLILTSTSRWVHDGQPGGTFGALTVLNAGTLEEIATTDITELTFGFGMVVTDTSAFIRTIGEQEVPALVEVDLATGTVSEPFATGQLVGQARLSGAGDTLIVALSSGTVLTFSMETHEMVDRYGIQRGQTIALVGGPAPVIDGRPIVVWKIGPNLPLPETPPATPLP